MSEMDDHVGQIPSPETGEKDRFPEGMRVLAVDDNMVCLTMLAALLRQCRYKVTITTEATKALKMLRENKDDFDIVITDVHMLDMDGFRLLEIIGLEMDLPVIMMSSNDDKNTVMKGIKHGARDYLLKPIRVEEIKNIWQHVIRKTLFDPNKTSIAKEPTDVNSKPVKRCRDNFRVKEEETHIQFDGDSLAQKKQRVAWSPELHDKFIDAVQRLGVDKAVPKKILELMNEPLLTRENVASHLQKFRNAMKKSNAGTSQESNDEIDVNRISGHLPNTTILSFDKHGHDSVHSLGRFGVNGHRNAEMIQFGHHVQNPGTFGISAVNARPPLLPINQQELLQRYPQAPQVMDQMRQMIPVPGLGDVSSKALRMGNSHHLSDVNSLVYQNSRPRPVNSYRGFSSHMPGSKLVSSGLPLIGSTPNSHPTGIFLDAANSSCMILGDASTETRTIGHHDSMVGPVQNFLPGVTGQFEGVNIVSCNGRGDLDFRGQITEVPSDMKGSIVEDFMGSGHMKLEHHLLEHLEAESNFHLSSCSSTDDDLNAAIKQFQQ